MRVGPLVLEVAPVAREFTAVPVKTFGVDLGISKRIEHRVEQYPLLVGIAVQADAKAGRHDGQAIVQSCEVGGVGEHVELVLYELLIDPRRHDVVQRLHPPGDGQG